MKIERKRNRVKTGRERERERERGKQRELVECLRVWTDPLKERSKPTFKGSDRVESCMPSFISCQK
jgi:hypothetical protein